MSPAFAFRYVRILPPTVKELEPFLPPLIEDKEPHQPHKDRYQSQKA